MLRANLSRREFLRRLVAGSAGIALASCQPQVSKETVKETVEVQKVVRETVVVEKAAKKLPTLRLVTDWSSGARGEVIKQARELWKEKYAGERGEVFFELSPEGVEQRVLIELASGDAPDVMLLGAESCLPLAKMGRLLELTPYFEVDPTAKYDPVKQQWDDLLGTATFAGQNGKVYIIPFQFRLMNFWVWNETLFDESGVPHPDDYPNNPGGVWTWDDWFETCRILTKDTDSDGTPDIWGFSPLSARYHFSGCLTLAWGNGGDELDLQKRVPGFDWPETMEAQNLIFDMVKKHKVAASPSVASQRATSLGMNIFYAGKVGTATSSFIALYGLKENVVDTGRFKAHYGPIPRSPHKPSEPGHVMKYDQPHCVSADSRYPDGAYFLASWMASEEVQTLVMLSGQTPCRRSLCHDERFIDWDPESKKWWLEMEKDAKSMPLFPCYREWRENLAPFVEKAMMGELTNEEFAAQATDAGQRIIDACDW